MYLVFRMFASVKLQLHALTSFMKNAVILTRKLNSISHNLFHVSSEVLEGLQKNLAILALESTIITHGMPYPQNIQTAIEVEEIVRHHGAIPATVGILNGKNYVGMTQQQMDILASSSDAVKISRRDFPYVMSKGLSGGTTVSATMIISHRVGIKVFATGGIGGVHRGGELSMDISADILELSKTPVTVVSSGVKSILDIGRTLECLETHGVCVTSFGNKKEFPAFFTPCSGYFSPCNVADAKEAAALIEVRDALKLESGILVAVPIPTEYATIGQEVEDAIQQALNDLKHEKVFGKDVTPFLLSRVNKLTQGSSLKANIALIKHNAEVGSQIAVELAKRKIRSNSEECNQQCIHHMVQFNYDKGNNVIAAQKKTSDELQKVPLTQIDTKRPVIVGGSILDLVTTVLTEKIEFDGRTHRGRIQLSGGGVGRNMADCLTRLGLRPLLVSVVGDDRNGEVLLSCNPDMDTSAIQKVPRASTATYCVVLDNRREAVLGIGDMEIHTHITEAQIAEHEDAFKKAPLVAIDGNIPIKTMNSILDLCYDNDIPVWYEPTDINKAAKPFDSDRWKKLTYASPNLNELRSMYNAVCRGHQTAVEKNKSGERHVDEIIKECIYLSEPILQHLNFLIVTLGSKGVLLLSTVPEEFGFSTSKHSLSTLKKKQVRALHYPSPVPSSIISVSGAGDCLAATMIGAISKGLDRDSCVKAGVKAAHVSLASHFTVPREITPSLIDSNGCCNELTPQEISLDY